MRISQTEKDGVIICVIDGEVNINTTYQLRDAFAQLPQADVIKVY